MALPHDFEQLEVNRAGLMADGTFVHLYPASIWQFAEHPRPLPLSQA